MRGLVDPSNENFVMSSVTSAMLCAHADYISAKYSTAAGRVTVPAALRLCGTAQWLMRFPGTLSRQENPECPSVLFHRAYRNHVAPRRALSLPGCSGLYA